MWIMVSGPYSAGAADAAGRAANWAALNRAALAVWRRGHVPIIGVNLALPIIAAADGDDAYDEIMMPLSMQAASRCDAVLRIGGPSAGADQEVAWFRERGLPVYRAVDEIPPADG